MASIPRTHCKDCNVKLNSFNALYSRTGTKPRCKECARAYEREQYKTQGHDSSKSQSSISQAEYERLLVLHSGGCAICRKPCYKKLAVDHNHKTGEVRGLLCQKCNTAIGLLYEDEDLIWNMLEYLKRTTWSKTA